MIAVIQRLLEGDRQIVSQFTSAREFWTSFFADKANWSSQQLAEVLGGQQFSYERIFDHDRPFAKETMPFTCLGTLYDEVNGWEDNRDLAINVAKAFLTSTVSIEVRAYAVEAIKLYDLDDYDDQLREAVRRRYGR